jgi:drug/metabolite transporter (DMT)-like permease
MASPATDRDARTDRPEAQRALGFLLVIVSACSFGSGALFAKPVYAAGVDWLTLLAWRFLFAAVLSWAWLLLIQRNRRALAGISRRRVLLLLGLGVLYVGNSATYFAALETVPASLAALIVYLYPVLVAVLTLRFGRRLRGGRAWVALALATAGVALAVGGIDPAAVPPTAGLLLTVASPLIYAAWIVIAARVGGERGEREHAAGEPESDREETEPAPAVALMMTATAVVYWIAAFATSRPVDPRDVPGEAWPGLLGVGVISAALAVQAFYAGSRRIGAARAALVSTVEPVYTITLATLLFGERLTLVQVLGGVLVIGAVLLVQLPAARDRRRAAQAVGTPG